MTEMDLSGFENAHQETQKKHIQRIMTGSQYENIQLYYVPPSVLSNSTLHASKSDPIYLNRREIALVKT